MAPTRRIPNGRRGPDRGQLRAELRRRLGTLCSDGDPASEWALTEYGGSEPRRGRAGPAAEGMFAYGSRVGFWRIMRLFQERGLPLTIFGCALALERNQPAAEAIKQAGYDVCCHGWRWEKHFEMAEDVERERIAPRGRLAARRRWASVRWLVLPQRTRREHAAAAGRGRWHFSTIQDAYDDELPYWTKVGGKPHLVVPVQPVDQRLEIRPRHVRAPATISSTTAATRSISCMQRGGPSRRCCRSGCICA